MNYEVDENIQNSSTGEVIRLTLKVYGSLFAGAVGLFVIVRPIFPLCYNFCNSVKAYNTKLAREHYGHIEWIWKIFQYTDDEIADNCGLTAIIFLRFLRMGIKISMVGILNSTYLIPINIYGCTGGENEHCHHLEDGVERIGLGHLSQGSKGLLATTFAAYVIFGATMYFLYKEFEWFTSARHKFLTLPRVDNYSVYIGHIPEEYRGDTALLQYFQSIFNPEDVLEANVALDIFTLDRNVANRDTIVQKLEHALLLRGIKGIEPTLITKTGENILSIPYYNQELEKLNNQISETVSKIEVVKEEERTSTLFVAKEDKGDNATSEESNIAVKEGSEPVVDKKSPPSSPNKHAEELKKYISNMKGMGVKAGVRSVQLATKSVQLATELIRGSEDGRVRDGGFVTFNSLTAKAQCVQMIHHETPFIFQVVDAPLPKDIFWQNVGLPHKNQQIGYFIAQVLTASLCIFWTIPIAFVSSLTEVDSLKKLIPGLENTVENHPWIDPLLAQLNPVLLILLKMLLPLILSRICEREGHISRTQLISSVMTKLSLFLIIQIFFIAGISGSIFEQLPSIIQDSRKIIRLLATSIPGQVKSFAQYVIVSCFLSCGLGLLRVVRVLQGWVRSRVGPNLSEKERKTTFMGIKPLTEVDEIDFPVVLAETILYLMILLVYSCIAPIMSYIMLMIFVVLLVTYMNQFLFVYGATNDQGGVLWPQMMKIILLCMMIAQVALIGVMGIKESALSSTLLIPLLCVTVLFALYLEQQHYKVTNFLPSTICKKNDIENYDNIDMSFLNGQYVQPALKAKHMQPNPFEETENGMKREEILSPII